MTWLQLPEVNRDEVKQAELVKGRFTGDASFEHNVPKSESDSGDDSVKLREEKRLTAVVTTINEEVQIVPRGAYYYDGNRILKKNPSYQGNEFKGGFYLEVLLK